MNKSQLDLPHIKLQIAHGLVNVQKPIRREEKKFLRYTEKLLEQIQNDPAFKAKFVKALEREILNFRRY